MILLLGFLLGLSFSFEDVNEIEFEERITQDCERSFSVGCSEYLCEMEAEVECDDWEEETLEFEFSVECGASFEVGRESEVAEQEVEALFDKVVIYETDVNTPKFTYDLTLYQFGVIEQSEVSTGSGAVYQFHTQLSHVDLPFVLDVWTYTTTGSFASSGNVLTPPSMKITIKLSALALEATESIALGFLVEIEQEGDYQDDDEVVDDDDDDDTLPDDVRREEIDEESQEGQNDEDDPYEDTQDQDVDINHRGAFFSWKTFVETSSGTIDVTKELGVLEANPCPSNAGEEGMRYWFLIGNVPDAEFVWDPYVGIKRAGTSSLAACFALLIGIFLLLL